MLQRIISRCQIEYAMHAWAKNNDHQKILFQHIPKTGGTYLGQGVNDNPPVVWPIRSLNHSRIIADGGGPPADYLFRGYSGRFFRKSWVKKYEVFSVVRNVYDWLVSYWKWCANPDHYDYDISQKGLDYLIKSLADRDSQKWPNRKMIHFAVFSYDGELMVDWINRTSSLDADIEKFAKSRNLVYRPGDKTRVQKRDRDYRTYYDDSLRDLVADTWGREMHLFGFEFGQNNLESAYLKNQIEPEIKADVKYLYHDDVLTIGGKVVPKNLSSIISQTSTPE